MNSTAPTINATPKIAFFLLNEPHMEQLMLFYANNPLFTFYQHKLKIMMFIILVMT